MIASNRSYFFDYRFDGGTVCLLVGFVIPWGLGASAIHLVSCRHVLGHACLIRPGVGIAFSFLARVCVISPGVASLEFPSSASLGGGYVPGCLSSSSSSRHHLVRRGRSFLSSSCSASSHRCPLFSSGAAIVRRTESVAFHQSLRLVLIELGKTARNMISRSSSSDVLGLLVPRLVSPVSWGVSYLICHRDGCSWRGSCLAVLLVSVSSGRGGMSFACPAAWRRACPHPSPIVSFCFSSFRLVLPSRLSSRSPMPCEPWAGRACSSHRDHSSRRAWLVVP